MRLLLICALLAVAGSAVAAQDRVTGGNAGTPDPMNEKMGRDPAAYSKSVTGTIMAVDASRGIITIARADASQLTFALDPKARIKADKDTDLASKKDLSLSDYKRGQIVKVSYRLADNKAIEIRLKRKS